MSELKRRPLFSDTLHRSPVKASGDADVTLLDSAEAVAPYAAALDELAANATDGNPLFEAATLAAALAHLQAGSPATVALIWSNLGGKRTLIGAFPYRARRFYLGLPVSIWTIWTHIHSFLATPLVRTGSEKEAIQRFLSFADRAGAPLVRFPLFQADGAFGAALTEVLAERGRPFAETGRHERAFLKSDLDGEAYLAAHMRKKKRKEYNRLWNRLAETGDLKFETPGAELDLGTWLESFLELERSGWKGKRGTALAERQNERDFFETMCRDAHAANKFHAAQIVLDGKPLAMLASFIAGGGAFSFKIAYGEDFARYSPGALLMMKVIGAFHDDPRIGWADSCAVPNHPMIDHIWAERRAISEFDVATSHPLSPSLVAYSSRMTRVAEKGWALARTLYHRLRKEVERD
ncbi:MAG: GNAT family N-acetyltransferase [Parvibaculum sp.]|uniref:GNAT family N-acetyltransferase n=1 Tax=Parvibaculum sp. TaxID=2024848 RepID=UPI0025FE5692|nr:GNAT family N-acetyltransferase [Parvibaculum sp.]MCE9649354.1 GNAT family N-acetyltransferase [Parvibaculum sp.]